MSSFARPGRPPIGSRGLAGLLLPIAIAACGTTTPQTSTSASQPTGAPTVAATNPAVPSAGAIATQEPGGDGGLTEADDFCLNTPEEVTAALRVGAVSAAGSANPGLGGGCLYSDAAGEVVYGISVVLGPSAAQAFGAYRSSPGVEDVPGIGDGAIYLPMNDLLGIAFLDGEVLASLSPTPGLAIQGDPSALRGALADLARQAAGRA